MFWFLPSKTGLFIVKLLVRYTCFFSQQNAVKRRQFNLKEQFCCNIISVVYYFTCLHQDNTLQLLYILFTLNLSRQRFELHRAIQQFLVRCYFFHFQEFNPHFLIGISVQYSYSSMHFNCGSLAMNVLCFFFPEMVSVVSH